MLKPRLEIPERAATLREYTDWPEKTILVYEGKANALQYRHNDRASLGFVDGHCKLTDSKQATDFLWAMPVPPK